MNFIKVLNNSLKNPLFEPYYFNVFSNQEKHLSDYKNKALIFGSFKTASFFYFMFFDLYKMVDSESSSSDCKPSKTSIKK